MIKVVLSRLCGMSHVECNVPLWVEHALQVDEYCPWWLANMNYLATLDNDDNNKKVTKSFAKFEYFMPNNVVEFCKAILMKSRDLIRPFIYGIEFITYSIKVYVWKNRYRSVNVFTDMTHSSKSIISNIVIQINELSSF